VRVWVKERVEEVGALERGAGSGKSVCVWRGGMPLQEGLLKIKGEESMG